MPTLKKLVQTIVDNDYYCILADEGTDSSKKNVFSLVLRSVSEDLEIDEFFIRFYVLNNLSSDLIINPMKISSILLNFCFNIYF